MSVTARTSPKCRKRWQESTSEKASYQEAIARYEQLARAYPGRFDRQLAEIKQRWVEMNLPPQYQSALANPVLTRSDLRRPDFLGSSFNPFRGEPCPSHRLRWTSPQQADVRSSSELSHWDCSRSIRSRGGPTRIARSARRRFLRIAARLLNLRGAPPCAGAAPRRFGCGSGYEHAIRLRHPHEWSDSDHGVRL